MVNQRQIHFINHQCGNRRTAPRTDLEEKCFGQSRGDYYAERRTRHLLDGSINGNRISVASSHHIANDSWTCGSFYPLCLTSLLHLRLIIFMRRPLIKVTTKTPECVTSSLCDEAKLLEETGKTETILSANCSTDHSILACLGVLLESFANVQFNASCLELLEIEKEFKTLELI